MTDIQRVEVTDIQRVEVTTRTVEYRLRAREPYGAAFAEVAQMLERVREERAGLGGIMGPDMVMVHVRGDSGDEEIVATFPLGGTVEDYGPAANDPQDAGSLRRRLAELNTVRGATRDIMSSALDALSNGQRVVDRSHLTELGDEGKLAVSAGAIRDLGDALTAAGFTGWWSQS